MAKITNRKLMELAKKEAKRSASNTMDAILLHNIRRAVKIGRIEGFVRDYLISCVNYKNS